MAYEPYKNPALEALIGIDLLPVWDSKLLFTFAAKQDKLGTNSLNPFTVKEPYPLRQRRLSNVSVDDSLLIVKEALKDNQAFFLIESNQPFRVKFPYSRYLKKGDPITNLTSGEVYTIANVYNDI